EPSSSEQLGDIIKNGRRGSLGATLTIRGIQGHVAYPHLAKNPIHSLAPFLNEICDTEWDQGSEHFPATTFQISNINGGTGVSNVIPATVCLLMNFRYSTALNHNQLMERVEALLKKYDLDFELQWNLSGKPFLTTGGDLIDATKAAIKTELNIDTELSTAGGTSDGRFIAPSGAQVIELGPRNATIHKIDECVRVSDLDDLSRVYERILHLMLV
ncbi:MAG: succinyl-diaminopimelate desuccinylase, partial [Thiohalomonadales bacterium]